MNELEFKNSQSDCAKLLGLTLKEYNENLKNIKCSKFDNKPLKDDILKKLGLSKKDLKRR